MPSGCTVACPSGPFPRFWARGGILSSSEPDGRWAVCSPALVDRRELWPFVVLLCPLLLGSHHVAHVGSGSGALRWEGTLVFWQSAVWGLQEEMQDSRAWGQGSGLEKGWKNVPVPKDVKLTRPRGKLTLVYLSNNMADLAEPGRDSSRLRQTCQRGDRSCRPPAPRGT